MIFVAEQTSCSKNHEDEKCRSINTFVLDFVLPGTTIIKDIWIVYCRIDLNNFTALKIYQKVYFVDPENQEVCTNTIERIWRSVKIYVLKQ
jgi:hypothetical protein